MEKEIVPDANQQQVTVQATNKEPGLFRRFLVGIASFPLRSLERIGGWFGVLMLAIWLIFITLLLRAFVHERGGQLAAMQHEGYLDVPIATAKATEAPSPAPSPSAQKTSGAPGKGPN